MAMVVHGTPVVTGTQVRAFLNGASGKMVYTKLDCMDQSCNKQGRSLWYVDFDDETLVEREIVDYYDKNTEPRNSIVSPDGQWVIYNTRPSNEEWTNFLYASRLQENAPAAVELTAGALPVWWDRPGTDESYVIFVDNDLENGGWIMYGFPSSSTGSTRAIRVNPTTMAPVGSPTEIMEYQANGGRSVSGAWMFVAGGCPGTFRIDPTGVQDVTVHETVSLSLQDWSAEDSLDGCNPSMSPHERDDDVRVMYVDGYEDFNHRAYWLCDVRGDNRRKVMWNSSENPYIDEPQWSNHPDYAAGKASQTNVTAPFDLYLFKVWDGSMIKVLEGNYSFPYLWVDPSTIDVQKPAHQRAKQADWKLGLSAAGISSEGVLGTMSVFDGRGRAVVSGYELTGQDIVPVKTASGIYTVRCRLEGGRVLSRAVVRERSTR